MPFEATPEFIRFTNGAGETVLDTRRQTLHVVQYISGQHILPRVSTRPWAQGDTPTFTSQSFTLEPVNPNAQILGGGVFKISNAEGLGVGQKRFLFAEGNGGFSRYERHLYAPRIDPNHVFMAGGVNILDTSYHPFTAQNTGPAQTGGTVMESGRLMHAIQFTLSGGNLTLQRFGSLIATRIVTYLTPGGITGGLTFDCAELTIDYRVWLGAFT